MENAKSKPPTSRIGYSASEIMVMLKMSRATFQRWKRKPGFPDPCSYAGRRPRWTKEAIESWAKEQH